MGYKLYGANGSGSSIVEAALTEAAIEYEMIAVDMKNKAHREAEYASINPHRKAPTLVSPEGETLTESSAILLTLDERHPQANLFPSVGSRERAISFRWLLFAATELYPIIEIVDYPERFSPDESATPQIRNVALEIWKSRWKTLEQELQKREPSQGPYLLGSQFSMTDVYLTVLSRWDLEKEWRMANIPTIERIANAVMQRPRLQEVWKRNFK